MSHVHVCGLDEMPACVTRVRARGVISLLQAELQPETPLGIAPDDHLRLELNDVDEETPGLIAPGRSHVEQLVGFLEEWDAEVPLLIHCWAGVSRSPAAALIALCLDWPGREAEAARLLRARGAHVAPNRRLLGLADEVLGRDGAIADAAGAMGEADFDAHWSLVSVPRLR